MGRSSHFARVETWAAAEAMLTFRPIELRDTTDYQLQTLEVFVRDHKDREISVEDRTLEAHFGAFVLTQSRRTAAEARRLALNVSYGPDPREARVLGREARLYELGPEVAPDDIDGRSPAVVVWCDDQMFYLVASTELSAQTLLQIATSMYPAPRGGKS